MKTWRFCDPSSLRWRRWEDGFIVFHVLSGDTHLLAHPVAEALLRLREGSSDAEGLVRAAGLEDPAGELSRAVSDLLARFEEFGVVEVDQG